MKWAAVSAALALAACSPGTAVRPQVPPPAFRQGDVVENRGAGFAEEILYDFPLNPRNRGPIFPTGTLVAASESDFYGTTSATAGFRGGAGSVYDLTRRRRLHVISRTARQEGSLPLWGVVRDRDGALYGATLEGGDLHCFGALGCGTVFKLTPSGTAFDKRTLHRFSGGDDGAEPTSGLTLDMHGGLYGTTASGGGSGCRGDGCGLVYKLTPAGERYRETILYRFAGGADGKTPSGGVVLDDDGDLFGVTARGGEDCLDSPTGCGTVYELIPRRFGYRKVVLYRFLGRAAGDGAIPVARLTRRVDGTLYGTTVAGGKRRCRGGGCGTVFELARWGSAYRERVLMTFEPAPGRVPPEPSVLLLHENRLFGTTAAGGRFASYSFPHGCGTAFVVRLPTGSSKVIHEFRGPPDDGAAPANGLVGGADGSLYGATSRGGTGKCLEYSGCGTIFRLAYLGTTIR
ncbi:MAG: hypothetical protein JO190_08490 [Candidatus Eremiobacteraeota bacterium]|nr:hypothetical protein [Candidatus Eremiobacteraeota bacterium]